MILTILQATISALELNVGAKLLDDQGLDAKLELNFSLFSASVGPFVYNLGLSMDTGVKIGTEGIGYKIMGTGIEIGRRVSFSALGSSFGFTLW